MLILATWVPCHFDLGPPICECEQLRKKNKPSRVRQYDFLSLFRAFRFAQHLRNASRDITWVICVVYYCVGSCGWHCAVVGNVNVLTVWFLDEFDFTNLNFALMDDGWPLFTSCGSSRKCSLSQDSIAANHVNPSSRFPLAPYLFGPVRKF